MGMLYHDYEFKSVEFQNTWRCLVNNTFENMELYYRKQFSMQGLLCYYKKAFGITPLKIKNSNDNKYYRSKILAIYLLTKYSDEDFEIIATEFNISIETVNLIHTNNIYKMNFQDDMKLFFKHFEDEYLTSRKSSLAWQEDAAPGLLDYLDENESSKPSPEFLHILNEEMVEEGLIDYID